MKKYIISAVVLLLLLLSVVFILYSMNNRSNKIVGIWKEKAIVNNMSDENNTMLEITHTIEIKKDGTGIWKTDLDGNVPSDKKRFNYKINKNKIKFSYDNTEEDEYTFSFDKKHLILENNIGKITLSREKNK